MQRFELITKLPSRLSCIVMQEWLNLQSVVALNSAFCLRSHRRVFTELLQSDEYCVCERILMKNQSQIWKLDKLGDKLRSVDFADKLTPEQEILVSEHCRNLTHVRFGPDGADSPLLPLPHC